MRRAPAGLRHVESRRVFSIPKAQCDEVRGRWNDFYKTTLTISDVLAMAHSVLAPNSTAII